MNRILCWGTALAAFCHPLSARADNPAYANTPSQFVGGTVIGGLGQPLGSREVIAGVRPEGGLMLANPLAVSEVKGNKLTNAVIIEIRGEIKINKGVTYRLEGYESGGFEGLPNWVAPGIQQPFQWRSFFVVTKVIDPK